jgi:hypothetical protein
LKKTKRRKNMSKKTSIVPTILVAAICMVQGWTAKGTAGGNAAGSVKLLINSGGNLIGDGQGQTSPDLYSDNTISGSTDPCVAGSTNSTGFTVVYPDRTLSDGSFCNASASVLNGHPARTFELYLNDSTGACEILGTTADASGYCAITADPVGYQRFELGSPFASKPSSSDRFAFDYNGLRWSVIPDKAASVQSLDTNTRVISYTGTAKLNEVMSTGPVPVTGSFPFTFSLTVQRVQ